MSYAQWCNSYTLFFFFCSLMYHCNSSIGVLLRSVYLFSLCVVLLLSSQFTASALVWIYNFLTGLLITSLHRPHRKQRSSVAVAGGGMMYSIVACAAISTGCPENTTRLLLCMGHCLAMGLHATILFQMEYK
jgi:hypothetical protein